MKTNITSAINHIDGAKTLTAAELSRLAMILPGHLRQVQGHTLRLIKKELNDFNAVKYEWEYKE